MFKRLWFFGVITIAVFILFSSAQKSHAETAKQYNIAVGGYFGIGGATEFFEAIYDTKRIMCT